MPAKNQSSTPLEKWHFIGISCGRDHTLAVMENGHVFGWGGNGSGRLPSTLPQYCTSLATRTGAVEIRNDAKIKSVSAGYGISLGITEHNTVQIWGASTAGIAGRLDGINPVVPQLLTLNAKEPTTICHIAANEFQFGALDNNGHLYTWGLNVEGALGREATQFNDAPGLVKNIPPITQFTVGRGHMLAIDESGTIHAWGSNGAGQLGLGHLMSTAKPQSHQSSTRYKAVAAGTSHSLALAATGRVYAWGSNHHGQLGDEGSRYSTQPLLVKLPEPITAIAAGMHFSMAIGTSGKVYAWGWNGHGQLGVGDTLDRHSPTQLNYVSNASAIAAGETHAVALTSHGLFGWGSNGKSQLGELARQQKFAAQLI